MFRQHGCSGRRVNVGGSNLEYKDEKKMQEW